MKLPVPHMQLGEPQQRSTIGLEEVEPHRLRIEDFQTRPRFEVHKRPRRERLSKPEILVPVELNDFSIKDLTVMECHPWRRVISSVRSSSHRQLVARPGTRVPSL